MATTARTLAVWLLLLIGAACASSPAVDEWRRFRGRVPGEHVRSEDASMFVWAGQIVDEETGAPIRGARVRVSSESGTIVLDGRGTDLGEGTSDENGFVEVTMPLDPRPSHWLVDADGYAPRTENRSWRWWPSEPVIVEPEPVIELRRGSTFRGRVVDVLGRPVPGVRISTYEGCRHAPAQQRAVSGADGRFRFERSAHTQVWIEGGGVAGRNAEWFPDLDGGALILAQPGVTVEGRVLSPTGRPLPGIWVRIRERGPATRTDANGRFRLEGAEPGWSLGLATDHAPTKNGVVVKAFSATVIRDPQPLLLHFDPEEAEAVDFLGNVRVTVRPGAAADDEIVTLVHEATGLAEHARVEGGRIEVFVPRGHTEVRVGSPLGAVWWRPFTVDLQADGEVVLPDPLPTIERPWLTVRLPDMGRADAPQNLGTWFTLWTGDGQFRWVEDLAEAIPVPTGTPLALHVHAGFLPCRILPFSIPPGTTGRIQRTFRLDPPADGSFVLHEAGDPKVWFRSDEDGAFHPAPTWYRGGSHAFVRPKGTSRKMYVEVRERDRCALVDIGDDALTTPGIELRSPRNARVEVRDDRGDPVSGASVDVRMHGTLGRSHPDDRQFGETDDRGGAVFRRLRPVTRIRVGGEDRWVHVRSVTGPGPFLVVVPSTTVTLRVPDGPRPDAWLRGRPMDAADAPRGLRLRNVPPGRHNLVVVFRGGRRWTREVVVVKGRDLTIGLPPSTRTREER